MTEPRLGPILWRLAKAEALLSGKDDLWCSRETFAVMFEETRTATFPANPLPRSLVVLIKALGDKPRREVSIWPRDGLLRTFGEFSH